LFCLKDGLTVTRIVRILIAVVVVVIGIILILLIVSGSRLVRSSDGGQIGSGCGILRLITLYWLGAGVLRLAGLRRLGLGPGIRSAVAASRNAKRRYD
jgi:hypothetical protein